MTLRASFAAVACCLVIALVAVVGFSAVASDPEPAPVAVAVDWAERPGSVEELAGLAPVVVEAEVVSVSAGEPLVPLDEGDPEGEGSEIPTLEVVFSRGETIEGTVPSTFVVQKTGTEDEYLDGDPPYMVGERYVLFIRPQAGGTGLWLPVAPDGRVLLEETPPQDPAPESATLFVDGGVKEELEGATFAEIASDVQGALQ